MAMSPRLLRPLASGAFSPKQIAGLAGWYDAADSSTLYTTSEGPVAPVSSPLDISGCVGWWDASDASTLFQSSNGTTAVTSLDDPVGYWGDLSGSGNNLTQATSSKRPLYKPGTLNGKPVLDFDGSDDFLSAVFALSQPVTIVCVARAENPASTDTLFDGGSPGNTMRLFTTNGGNLALFGGAQITSPALDPSEWGALSAVFNGASSSLSKDGATLASGNAGTASPGGLHLGLFGNGSSAPGEAQFAEFFIYDRALTASERARVEAYLANKWSISGVHKSVAEEQSAVASPLELGGCMGWWDASESSTITLNGANVSEWRDRSGLGRHVSMATEANQPAYVASSLNGKGGIDWGTPGSSKRLSRESLSFTARDFFIVADFDGGATFSNFETLLTPTGIAIPIGGDGAGTVAWRQFSTSDRVILNNVASSSTALPTISSPFVLQSTYTAASAASACTAIHFGQFATFANRGWGGKIYEVVIFDRDLTSVESARVAKYLQQKWATPTVPDPTPPVGYWGDKSGNGRHATQATAGSRPTIGSQNGRRALSANGSSHEMALTNAGGVTRNAPGVTIIAALSPNTVSGIRTAVFFSVGNSTGARSLLQFNGAEVRAGGRRLDADSFDSATGGTIVANQPIVAVARLDYANANAVAYSNSAPLATDTSFLTAGLVSDTASQASSIMNSSGGSLFYSGIFAELLVYNRALTDAERRKAEIYLARKWGITLAPQVSNADAQDWVNRVYAAGSTVSQPVANAVSAFVDGCQADGIWDAMKSVVLLAGADTLAGALVPLKGTAPTNNNFVSGDYNRGTGLVGNGSTKFLNSNRNCNADPQDSHHLAVYASALDSNAGAIGVYAGAGGSGVAGSTMLVEAAASPGALRGRSRSGTLSSAASNEAVGFMAVGRSSSAAHVLRTSGSSSSHSVTSDAAVNANYFVYGTNSSGSAANLFNGRLAYYSIGESLDLADLDTRVSNLITAIGNAFAPAYADADVNAYISAVELADGGTMLEPAVRDAYNDFITGCKADGIWDAIKASCILAGARTLAGALVPLKGAAPTNNNFVSGDYNRETGLVGNGTSKYLDSNRANNADPQDSKHISCYASNAGSATRRVMTSGWSANGASQLVRGSGYTARINAAYLSDVAIGTGTVASGFVGASRSSDSAISGRNGGTTSVDVAQASTSPNAENLLLYKGQLFSNARLAFYSIGESLDLDLLDTRVSALITAIENAI